MGILLRRPLVERGYPLQPQPPHSSLNHSRPHSNLWPGIPMPLPAAPPISPSRHELLAVKSGGVAPGGVIVHLSVR
jgi:hypothetical protein